MLLQRLITAAILIPIVVLGVLYLPTTVLAVLFAGIVLLGAREWAELAKLPSITVRVAFYAAIMLGLLISYWSLQQPDKGFWLFSAATLWWGILTVVLFVLRAKHDATLPLGGMKKFILGVFILVSAWAGMVALHGYGEKGPVLLLFALTLTWVADSGAYFAGRKWGKNKLAPAISPGKTMEGVYGALAGAALWGVLLAWYAPEIGSPLVLVIFCILVCVVSVVGDLFESVLKRQAGMKDSGNLLPGHGGVLDRIDSLTAVAPVFAFGLLLLGGTQ